MDTRKEDRKNLGFYRARLSDSDALYKIIPEPAWPSAIPQWIAYLKEPSIYVFINYDQTALVAYLPTYGQVPWLSTHSWTLPAGRGLKLKKFYLGTGLWIVENTKYTTITSVIPDELKMHGLFLAACGAKRVAYLDGTTMYAFTKDRLNEIKEKLRCLKDYQQ